MKKQISAERRRENKSILGLFLFATVATAGFAPHAITIEQPGEGSVMIENGRVDVQLPMTKIGFSSAVATIGFGVASVMCGAELFSRRREFF